MQLFIPACGDRLTLSEPWTFTLLIERRNVEFAKILGILPKDFSLWRHERHLEPHSVTLPAGTTLECDRIYIRTYNKSRIQQSNDYDSITWRVIKPNGKPALKQRFWVKLPDCYEIQYNPDDLLMYRDRVKAIKLVHEA